MTFLQPWLLVALPLVALPVIIHLVNQQRFQSVEWAAMRFLLAARLLSRGYSRLRQWLIMLMRMAAVAAAILAISRPLSQGWLALAGGDRSAAAIVLFDRSPSMSQAAAAGGESKLVTARRQVAAALETLGTRRVVLIDSVSGRPQELSSPRALERLPETEPAAAAGVLPHMLQGGGEHQDAGKSAASTIWICSDQRANDWKAVDAGWPAIRETLAKTPQSVRITLLGYADKADDNLAVRVPKAALEPRGKGWELRLDLVVRRPADTGPARVPVQIELGPARSTVEVELTGTETLLAGHTIPIDTVALAAAEDGAGDGEAAEPRGWGRVSLPADANPTDNDFYFTFGMPPVRRTLVVTESAADSQATAESRRTLELIAGIPPDKLLRAAAEAVSVEAVAGMSLDDVAVVLWQAPLPGAGVASVIDRFVARGGQVIFLPPDVPTTTAYDGISWQSWTEHSPPVRPTSWRADEGLLAATQTGAALPVGELELRRTCGLAGEGTPLAVLPDARPLLLRAVGDRGGVSFLATTPAGRDSDLAANGIVLYAIVQRAIDAGLASVGSVRQIDAVGSQPTAADGRDEKGRGEWRQIAGPPAASNEAGSHAGVYEVEGRLVAVNRPAAEDAAAVVDDRQIERLFQGLSFGRFEQKAGDRGGIVEEIWRVFLMAVLVALVVEGLLCLPRRFAERPRGREAVA
ncbi:MAG: BatA domain-containing protein [Planctomycetia bacterium]